MAMEPITLFARIADPAGVALRLRELSGAVVIDGPDDNWRNAVITFGRWWNKRTLTLTHDPAYYSEPNWSTQMSGMRGYLSGFPDTERKELAITLTTTFRFSLGTLFEPDFNPESDSRLDVLFAVAEYLDGVLFTPSSLRDAHGRTLYGAGGKDEENPDAVWPRVVGEVSLDTRMDDASKLHEVNRDGENTEEGADPPNANRVARRALALMAVTIRAILEQDVANHVPEAADTYRELLAWVKEIGIEDELEPDEAEFLQQALGAVDEQMLVNSTWRLEGLTVLAWALRRFAIPPHDELVTPKQLWRGLNGLETAPAKALLAEAVLRPRKEIEALRKKLFAIHWRLRNFNLHRRTMNFAEFAKTCWFGPLDISELPLVKGDLGLRGKRIDRATAEVFSIAHSAAQERHQAANWLWEGPVRYSEASVDT